MILLKKERCIRFLTLCVLFLLSSCTKAEGAKAEAVFLEFMSLMGLCTVLAVLVFPLILATLSKGSEYKKIFLIVSVLALVAAALMMILWTVILLTDYMHSDAYYYGEGVVFIFSVYAIALLAVIATGIYTQRKFKE